MKGGHPKVYSSRALLDWIEASLKKILLNVSLLFKFCIWITSSTFPWVLCQPWKYFASLKLLILLGVILYINLYISLYLFQVACDSLADTVFNTVWTLGCRPFMNSQRAACICVEEDKEEL